MTRVRLCANCNNGYDNIIDHCPGNTYVHLERVSLWDKIYQFDPKVYLYLRRLDKASLTSAFLGEERVDFVSLLSDDCTRFWYVFTSLAQDMTYLQQHSQPVRFLRADAWSFQLQPNTCS